MNVSVDMTLVIALLMKNEDVWLKMPSQSIYDEVITALKVVGIDFEENGSAIQIISIEGKIKRLQQKLQQQLEFEKMQAILTQNPGIFNNIIPDDFQKLAILPKIKG